MEVQRINAVAPLAGPRRVLEDTMVDGYLLPKDTTVLISTGDLHMDSKLFKDPHEFKPERFIDETGLLKNSERLYHFGMGELKYFIDRFSHYTVDDRKHCTILSLIIFSACRIDPQICT